MFSMNKGTKSWELTFEGLKFKTLISYMFGNLSHKGQCRSTTWIT